MAAMLQELHALRQVVWQQEQRHVQEIQLLQDKCLNSKTNNWGAVSHIKNLKVFNGDGKERSDPRQVSQPGGGRRWESGGVAGVV